MKTVPSEDKFRTLKVKSWWRLAPAKQIFK